MARTTKILVISQILVANELDVLLADQLLHRWTDERIELVLKLIKRWV